jgi:hypothetical protein
MAAGDVIKIEVVRMADGGIDVTFQHGAIGTHAELGEMWGTLCAAVRDQARRCLQELAKNDPRGAAVFRAAMMLGIATGGGNIIESRMATGPMNEGPRPQ